MSLATGLPRELFAEAPGTPESYQQLILLTEASHCGFLARVTADSSLIRAVDSSAMLVRLIEAIGDVEATEAFWVETGPDCRADEGDDLFAARELALCVAAVRVVTGPGEILTPWPARVRLTLPGGIVAGGQRPSP